VSDPGKGLLSMTLWIGTNDFLIHQRQSVNRPEVVKANGMVANLTETLEGISINKPFVKEDFDYPVPAGLKPSE
jgi:hypothetical protein